MENSEFENAQQIRALRSVVEKLLRMMLRRRVMTMDDIDDLLGNAEEVTQGFARSSNIVSEITKEVFRGFDLSAEQYDMPGEDREDEMD